MREICIHNWNIPDEKEAENPRNQPRSGLHFLLLHSASVSATPGETPSTAAAWEVIFLRNKGILLNCDCSRTIVLQTLICNSHLGKLMLLNDAEASCQLFLLIINMCFWSGCHGYRKLQRWLTLKSRVPSFIQGECGTLIQHSSLVPSKLGPTSLCAVAHKGRRLGEGSLLLFFNALWGAFIIKNVTTPWKESRVFTPNRSLGPASGKGHLPPMSTFPLKGKWVFLAFLPQTNQNSTESLSFIPT